MAFAALIPLAIAAVQAIAAKKAASKANEAAKAGTQQNTTQTTNMSQTGQFANESTGMSSTMPMYDELGASSRDQLLRSFMAQVDPNRINQQAEGITAGNAMNINAGADASRRILSDRMSSMGLGFSPAAATAPMQFDMNRIGQQVQNTNQAPLIRQQLMDNALRGAGGFFSSLPVGQQTTTAGSQSGTSQQNTQGTVNTQGSQTGAPSLDPWAVAGNNMAGTLAGFYGQGAFAGAKPASSPASTSQAWRPPSPVNLNLGR